jgi:hypothetical protein
MQRTGVFVAALTLAFAISQSASAACSAGDRIDGTTADYAKGKFEAAGYAQVRGLTKGCDNFWHGRAIKDGVDVNVLLTPEGEVMQEGA